MLRSDGNDSDKEGDNNSIAAPSIGGGCGNESDGNGLLATTKRKLGHSERHQIQDLNSDTEIQFIQQGTTRDQINATPNSELGPSASLGRMTPAGGSTGTNGTPALPSGESINNKDDIPALSNEEHINNEDG